MFLLKQMQLFKTDTSFLLKYLLANVVSYRRSLTYHICIYLTCEDTVRVNFGGSVPVSQWMNRHVTSTNESHEYFTHAQWGAHLSCQWNTIQCQVNYISFFRLPTSGDKLCNILEYKNGFPIAITTAFIIHVIIIMVSNVSKRLLDEWQIV